MDQPLSSYSWFLIIGDAASNSIYFFKLESDTVKINLLIRELVHFESCRHGLHFYSAQYEESFPHFKSNEPQQRNKADIMPFFKEKGTGICMPDACLS